MPDFIFIYFCSGFKYSMPHRFSAAYKHIMFIRQVSSPAETEYNLIIRRIYIAKLTLMYIKRNSIFKLFFNLF